MYQEKSVSVTLNSACKSKNNKSVFLEGMKDALPIALAYLAVGFTIGIAAQNVGLNAVQGFLASFLNNASAGEFAAFSLIGSNGAYWQIALVTIITNARYMLMSCALSQRFDPKSSPIHRLVVGFGVTDEIFGITIAKDGYVNPYYTYGAMLTAMPCWAIGTAIGVVAGNLLPASVLSALSVALYGMFLAIIIPPAKKDKAVAIAVACSFVSSFGMSFIPGLSDGMRIIILTAVISAIAAVIFPVTDEREEKKKEVNNLNAA